MLVFLLISEEESNDKNWCRKIMNKHNVMQGVEIEAFQRNLSVDVSCSVFICLFFIFVCVCVIQM